MDSCHVVGTYGFADGRLVDTDRSGQRFCGRILIMVDKVTWKEVEIIETLVSLGVLKDWACTVEGDDVWFFDEKNTERIYRSQILNVLRDRHARAIIEAMLNALKE